MSRIRVSSGGPWEDRIGYSRAVRVGDHVWVSGTTGTHPDGSVPADVIAQTRVALRIIERALTDAGVRIEDVVMVRVYVTNIAHFDAVAAALRERFGETRPAASMVEVSRLALPEHLVEIEVEAVANSA